MHASTTANGSPAVMFEIMAIRPEVLQAFYSAVFGWNYQVNSAGFAYIHFPPSPPAARPALGGIGQADERIPGNRKGITFYLQVDCITDTLARIREHGGTEVMPRTEADGYAFGMFADPEHNLAGLIEPFKA